MNKIFSLIVIGIVLSGLGAVALADNIRENYASTLKNKSTFISSSDELDQSQIDNNTFALVGRFPEFFNFTSNVTIAQSFIPQKEVLTRVELMIGRNTTTTYDYVVAIRKELTEEDLTITKVSAADILEQNFSWIEFDFADIPVTIGDTYYIVSYTANVTENWYLWASNNDSESYPYGCAWVSFDDGDTWSNDSISGNNEEWNFNDGMAPINGNETWDMCFKTHGRDAYELEVEVKSGIGLNTIISNVGDGEATDIEFKVTAIGGIFGKINVSEEGVISSIPAGSDYSIKISVFGLGRIEITAIVEETEVTAEGFVLLFFVIIIS